MFSFIPLVLGAIPLLLGAALLAFVMALVAAGCRGQGFSRAETNHLLALLEEHEPIGQLE